MRRRRPCSLATENRLSRAPRAPARARAAPPLSEPANLRASFAPGVMVRRLLRTAPMDPVTSTGALTGAVQSHFAPGGVIADRFQIERTKPSFLDHLLCDGSAASEIHNEHLQRVYEVGTLDCGTPSLLVEYLEGVDFGTVVRTDGPLGIEAAMTCVLQICDALADADTSRLELPDDRR